MQFGSIWGDSMNRSDIKVCVLRIEGTNNEDEMYHAFKRLGASPELVHLKDLRDIFDYNCLMIPGGFSAGDYVRAGAIFASRIRAKMANDLHKFIDEGWPVGGICNGFQVLVELGVLPGFKKMDYPDACLFLNNSARFECRPTLLKHENKGKCVFTRNIPKGEVMLVPSAHGEGKLLFPREKEKAYFDRLFENDQIVFRYVDKNGEYAGYPWNPNGSAHNIAGICNEAGNVFGMMPHPERAYFDKNKNGFSGMKIFESVLKYIEEK